MKSKLREIIKKWIPYRKMDELVKVTFYFSDILGNDYQIIEDILKKHGSFFTAGVHTVKKVAYANFYKDKLNLNPMFIDLKNSGLPLIPEKTKVEPSTEHELNCVTIIILGIIIYILGKVLL